MMKIYRIFAIIMEHLITLRRHFEEIVETFFWPVIDIIIWGLMTSYFMRFSESGPGKVAVFLMGGLILWNIVWRSQQDISMTLLRDAWSHNLVNLFTTPLSHWEFLTAVIILGLIKIFLTMVLVIGIAFFFYHFNLFMLGFNLLPFIFNLLVFSWTIGLVVTGLILRYGLRIQALSWSFIALFHPFSAVFYPVSALPGFLQFVSWSLPTAHIFEAMRMVMGGETGGMGWHLIWASGLNVVYLGLGIWFFNFMFEKAREMGKLVKIEE